MDWTDIITTLALVAFVPLVGIAMKWLSAQKWAADAERDFFASVESGAQFAKDAYLLKIEQAKDPNSPGGAVVTEEEKQDARAEALRAAMQSMGIPALKYAKDKGEKFIMGWIGKYLDRILPGSGVVHEPGTSGVVNVPATSGSAA